MFTSSVVLGLINLWVVSLGGRHFGTGLSAIWGVTQPGLLNPGLILQEYNLGKTTLPQSWKPTARLKSWLKPRNLRRDRIGD